MKKILTPIFYFFLMMVLGLVTETSAQKVGIGTTSPDHKLHIASNTSTLLKLENTTGLNTGIMSEMYFKTGAHYTGAIKTIGYSTVAARLGFYTYAVTSPGSLIERMSILDNGYVGIGTNNPGYLLDVNGRMRVRHNGNNTAGILFMESQNTQNRFFVGMKDDNTMGIYGYHEGVWGLTYNQQWRQVNVNTVLVVTNDDDPGYGDGIVAKGGRVGVDGDAYGVGSGDRYGVAGRGGGGIEENFGVAGLAIGGAQAYGIYGNAIEGSTNWAGYFKGNIYSTGSYQGSDRKLKSDIQPLTNAIQLIQALKPSTYLFKTDEFAQMNLPQGEQYGLIADEVKQVFPSLVIQTISPTQFENNDPGSEKVVEEAVSFEAVNYTAMIPVLIAAVQEQQAMIKELKMKINELKAGQQ